MDTEFNIFLSYSWKDASQKDNIIKDIDDIEGVNLIVDHLNIPEGDYIFEKISEFIDKANVLLILISQDSVKSLSVRDELIISYERNCEIIEICIENNCQNLEVYLPSFLKNRKRLSLDDDIVEIIEKKKNTFCETGFKYTLRKEFAKLRQHIYKIDRESEFDNVILYNILNKVNSEAKQIEDKNYEVDLSRSNDFLRRAGSIFHSANNVYAITVSWVSDFWSDDNNANDTFDYLIDQKPNTIRLFVFDKPEEIKRFKEILDANYEIYGNEGAVLITSKEFYETTILDQIGVRNRDRKEFINKDFGVLVYNNFEIYAWLDKTILGFTDVSLGRQEFGIDNQQFKHYLENLQNVITCGSFLDGVYRWAENQNKEFFISVYTKLFPKTVQDTIMHIIFFKNYNIVNLIAEIKSKIEKFSEYSEDGRALDCIDIWYGKVNDYTAVDKEYVARLIKDEEYQYILIMKFKNQNALEDWYNHPEHSDMRRKLYTALSDNVKKIYEQIDSIDNDDEVDALFRKIEIEMKQYIKRIDYTYEYDYNAIEHIHPYNFIKKFQARKKNR